MHTTRNLPKIFLCMVATAVLFSAGTAFSFEKPRQGEDILRDTYHRNLARLETNSFGLPLFLESFEHDDRVHVDVYGVFDYPFSSVVNVLKVLADWCDIVSLHPNVKACTSRDQPADGLLSTAAEAIRELVKPVALINDELKRNLLIRNIAQKFNLTEKLLESELDKQIKQVKRFQKPDVKFIQSRRAEETSAVLIDAVTEISPVLYHLEKEILKLLFEADKPVAELIFNYLHPEDFSNSINRDLFEMVKDEFESADGGDNFTTSGLVSVLKDERKETYVREFTFDKYSVSSSWEERFPSVTTEMTLMKFVKDTVMKFVIEKIEKRIQSNRREIDLAEDDTKLIQLMKLNNELEGEKKRIREELSQ